ncbi:MAG: VOC family protein [Pigmentiphaga sp.]|uniref:VOC family protein n=1 Tax=Pigmentiphaga sp. TaxID=1977564 RepID=UPI0029A43C7B|nr:VOC family protein [Pigmentiphaga sp.]MDX3904391.1 VOC family protein [Pigmentiphaga sp.]
MDVLGIDEITYGADDLAACKQFLTDWGMTLAEETDKSLVFESLNKCRVIVKTTDYPGLPPAIEEGPTLREVVWGVSSDEVLERFAAKLKDLPGYVNEGGRVGCTDPNGLAVRFQTTRKIDIEVDSPGMNTWSNKARRNQRSPIYERATPIEVGHVVFFVKDVKACEKFYAENFGFVASDRYPNKGAFMRCSVEGGHHDLFLLQPPEPRAGLNHVAFTVRDIHEVFGGGMAMARQGWSTQLGPGRHPISSAYFWYFNFPGGGLIEYYADEDYLDAEWEAREFEPGPTVFAEWAIDGGLDGHTRRQKNAKAPDGKFLTEKK